MVCRRRRDSSELWRCGLGPGAAWYLGGGVGRGVWWCREGECGSRVDRRELSRALRRELGDESVAAFVALRNGEWSQL